MLRLYLELRIFHYLSVKFSRIVFDRFIVDYWKLISPIALNFFSVSFYWFKSFLLNIVRFRLTPAHGKFIIETLLPIFLLYQLLKLEQELCMKLWNKVAVSRDRSLLVSFNIKRVTLMYKIKIKNMLPFRRK